MYDTPIKIRLSNRGIRGDPPPTDVEVSDGTKEFRNKIGNIWDGTSDFDDDPESFDTPPDVKTKMHHKLKAGQSRSIVIKKISFFFIRSGQKALTDLKKVKALKEQGASEEEITEEKLQIVGSSKIDRKTCRECVIFQFPTAAGQYFNHVEVCYHGVEFQDDFGDTVNEDVTLTSLIEARGGASYSKRRHRQVTYTDVWELGVSESLFYESYIEMRSIIETQTSDYNFFKLMCVPFFDSLLCKLFHCGTPESAMSCSRLALLCLLSLKFGSETFYQAAARYNAVEPDDIHALLERFEYLLKYYPQDVVSTLKTQKEIRELNKSSREIAEGNYSLSQTRDQEEEEEEEYIHKRSRRRDSRDISDGEITDVFMEDDEYLMNGDPRDLLSKELSMSSSQRREVERKKEERRLEFERKRKEKRDRRKKEKKEKRVKEYEEEVTKNLSERKIDDSYLDRARKENRTERNDANHVYNDSILLTLEKQDYHISSKVKLIAKMPIQKVHQ